MARRLVLGILFVLLAVTPAAAQDLEGRKGEVDGRLSELRARIADADAREAALADRIASVTVEIRRLEAEVGDVSARLEQLERDLALHRDRLARLNELFELQTARLIFLRRQYGISLERLNRRIVTIYETDDVDVLDVVLESASFSDLLEHIDYVNQIGSQDRRIADAVGAAKVDMRAARARTKRTRTRVAGATRVLAIRTAQVRAVRDRLLTRRNQLASARGAQQEAVASVRASKEEFVSEAAALEAASADLAARIRAAQAAPPPPVAHVTASVAPPAVSSSGLIWPVAGPVTSFFGMRWGRMHEGIDIGAATGTPVQAAAAGIVVSAGWMGGYGNLVVVDHGGGLSTAYAHLSGYAVSGGQRVSQGQTVGYVGCTGHCYGPHLHFEVRVHGSPVDPLGYL